MEPYRDDLERVPPGSELVRRIAPTFVDWSGVKPRITSQAFQLLSAENAARYGCPGPGMSLVVLAMSDPEELVKRYAGGGLAVVSADLIRSSADFGVDFRPTGEEPAHAVAFRHDGGRNVPGGLRDALSRMASERIIVLPPR